MPHQDASAQSKLKLKPKAHESVDKVIPLAAQYVECLRWRVDGCHTKLKLHDVYLSRHDNVL